MCLNNSRSAPVAGALTTRSEPFIITLEIFSKSNLAEVNRLLEVKKCPLRRRSAWSRFAFRTGRFPGLCSPHVLEAYLQGPLHHPWRRYANTRNLPEVAARWIIIGNPKARPVECVEHLPPELHIRPFADAPVLIDAEIH